jgi:glycosyltransferase involved in cell wall biosynthesis
LKSEKLRESKMRWLIVEDSLESRQGHWFEYLEGFCRELPKVGDEVTLLVSRRAEPFIQEHLGGLPVLPESVYLKMSDGAPAWRRNARIPAHAVKTFWAVRRQLRAEAADVIFVPTVTAHHLLGWFWLVKTTLRCQQAKVLLFFPGLPLCQQKAGAMLDGSPTSRLMRSLLRQLKAEIRNRKLILGVETHEMKQAAEQAFAVPFAYFPHPVAQENEKTENRKQKSEFLTFACYGAARHEKGSDVLVAAIEEYLNRFPNSRVKFLIQWLEDFSLPDKTIAELPKVLKKHPQVEVIRHFFGDGEYAQRLAQTHVLLLPYRQSTYGLRVSRVAIEAMTHGIPIVVTRGTTMEDQTEQFGAALPCEDGDKESLVKAIGQMEQNFEAFKMIAEQKRSKACEHFSVRQFRNAILAA